jgi:hypothetical protein
MLRRNLMLTASVGLAIVSTAPARADICFEYTVSGGGVATAIGAKVPVNPNTCDRVTVVTDDGGVATGSICRSQQGAGGPVLVYHYVFNGCATPYFESATCRIRLEDQGDLPSDRAGAFTRQTSSCSGVVSGMAPGQTSPLRGFSYSNDLKAWNCTPGPFVVISGEPGAVCYARRRGLAPQQ